MAPIVLRVPTAAEGPQVAANNIPAYWTNPNWALMWAPRSEEYVTKQNAMRQPANLLRDREHNRHQVAVDEATGRIVGYARWALPNSRTAAWPECVVPAVSPEDEKQYAATHARADWQHRRELDELDIPVIAMRNRLAGRQEHMELEYLAVHPDFKGQGIGSMLVESGIAQAQLLNLRIFINAFKAAVGLYQRLGFTLLDQIVQDDSRFGGPGDYGMYFLEWMPVGGDGSSEARET